MKMDAGFEQRFIAEVDGFEFGARDVEHDLRALNDWRVQLSGALRAHPLVPTRLKEGGALATRVLEINSAVETLERRWSQQWDRLQAARKLAEIFDGRMILLVFGKFNAGKSSLCNLLAERFAAYGKRVKHFHVENDEIIEIAGKFKEGATETTARLQGVQLGRKLVLLDTPGLHSTTRENASLTQRFIDSADGVLWLTSSASPGQVQELDELGHELHRRKPLLPVLTRSDCYEEDEVDGALVKFLRNKTPQNRALQEADVAARAREKLVAMGVDPELLGTPVSISAHTAREQGQSPSALNEAGFERLYEILLELAAPALQYKRRKPAEMFLHHLQESAIGSLQTEIVPRLQALDAALQATQMTLGQRQEGIANAVWRRVVPTLPELLEKHAATQDVESVCLELSQSLLDAFSGEVEGQLACFHIDIDVSLARVGTSVGYEDAGVFGVDYVKLYADIEKQLQSCLSRLTSSVIRQCHDGIDRLQEDVRELLGILRSNEKSLQELACGLRSEELCIAR